MTAPERPSTSWDLPATEAQVAFLISLAAQRGIERPAVTTRGEASDAIDALRAMPRRPHPVRPFVSIQPVVVVWEDETGHHVHRSARLLHVRCSECGPLSEWEAPDDDVGQLDLQRQAVEHADVVHDGEVDALGWTPSRAD